MSGEKQPLLTGVSEGEASVDTDATTSSVSRSPESQQKPNRPAKGTRKGGRGLGRGMGSGGGGGRGPVHIPTYITSVMEGVDAVHSCSAMHTLHCSLVNVMRWADSRPTEATEFIFSICSWLIDDVPKGEAEGEREREGEGERERVAQMTPDSFHSYAMYTLLVYLTIGVYSHSECLQGVCLALTPAVLLGIKAHIAQCGTHLSVHGTPDDIPPPLVSCTLTHIPLAALILVHSYMLPQCHSIVTDQFGDSNGLVGTLTLMHCVRCLYGRDSYDTPCQYMEHKGRITTDAEGSVLDCYPREKGVEGVEGERETDDEEVPFTWQSLAAALAPRVEEAEYLHRFVSASVSPETYWSTQVSQRIVQCLLPHLNLRGSGRGRERGRGGGREVSEGDGDVGKLTVFLPSILRPCQTGGL
ncbi:hypothetical protein KIPB_006507 [Kipferlia bialata]|uniref:Uncharacterized protein n=1 Tax=Kipferlia bialata TaxID=797122 RepID=A0A9K3CZ28_9EUKA|nr:hypothetical protein KIPB_006507 [Kipferlia bialata]|eukprot:g6507.t1